MLAAKFAAPYESNPVFRWPALEHTAESLITLFVSPPGYLYAGGLAEALTKEGKSLFWLRLGREDRDPATFLLSLIGTVRKVLPSFGASTLTRMQRTPGPIAGWPPLYSHLAEELAESLPESSVMIFEHAHLLSASQPTLSVLGSQLLAGLPASIPSIILSHKGLPSESFPAHMIVKDSRGLKVDTQAGLLFVDDVKMTLPFPLLQRTLALMDGRAVPLVGIVRASRVLGLDFMQRLVSKCRSGDQLLDRIVRAWLSATNADELRSLSLALNLNYIHPQIMEAVFGSSTMPTGPWLQLLNDDWHRIWCVWDATLRSVLNSVSSQNNQIMKRAVEFLLAHDAKANAVRQLFELKDFSQAAKVVTELAEGMLNLGQWLTLERWLNLLPKQVLYDWPQLIYVQGELSAARGVSSTARRSFATAARLYAERRDQGGSSKSLLAEATLAAWDNQGDHARICALMANTLAASAGLAWYQGLASWLLGCLSASSGQMDDALIYFGQAADLIKEPRLAAFFNQVETLAQRQHMLRRQREFHQQALKAAAQSEQDTQGALISLINTPIDDLSGLLDSLGWSNAPLMLKLASPLAGGQDFGSDERSGLWQKMLSLLGLNGREKTSQESLEEGGRDLNGMAITDGAMAGVSRPMSFLQPFTEARHSVTVRNETITFPPLSEWTEISPTGAALPLSSPEEQQAGTRLSAYTLGKFRLSIDDENLLKPPSGRGLAVLKILLANNNQVVPREVLMDTLWRDAEPNAARNRLNVALHSLRSALRSLTQTPIILFQEGNYFFNGDIQVWIDFEEFERHLQAGHQLEAAGQLTEAIVEYEIAASFYQGDYCEEDLYEDWPVLTRERLRVAYLDVLDRLSQIYFSRTQYAACVALCQQILDRDNCREDAHCRLMRCFSRQGQQHLALRQYQACAEALFTELEVVPGPATLDLAERIRRRERV